MSPSPSSPPTPNAAEPNPADPLPTQVVKVTERPHPLTPLIRGWVVIVAAVFAFGRDLVRQRPQDAPPVEFWLYGIGLVAVVAAGIGFVSWRFTRFVLDDEELRIDTGLWQRRSTRIALGMLQSVDISQPLAARMFGLAELQLDVGTGKSLQLRYLELSRAQALRLLLLRTAPAQTASGQETGAGQAASRASLIQVTPFAVIVAALTSSEFFMILISGIAMGLLGFHLGIGIAWLAIAFTIGSALVGFIARRVTGQFNYSLSRDGTGLRISRGMFHLTNQHVSPHRIQAVTVRQPVLWRLWGWYQLDVSVLGWDAEADADHASRISQTMLPVATRDQLDLALGEIWPGAGLESVSIRPVPIRARWRHPLTHRFLGWGQDQNLFITRWGWTVRTWQLVPLRKVQSIATTQGPWLRRLGLVNLGVHLAGTPNQATAFALDPDIAARYNSGSESTPINAVPIPTNPAAPD